MNEDALGRPVEDPDSHVADQQYRQAAPGYDRHMRRFARWQREAVQLLALRRGDVVIDVACGTGLNFAQLEAGIGPDGRLIGIDLSAEMLEQARKRVAAEGWANVTLVEARMENADFEDVADAALFSFTHDVLQSPKGVANVVSNLRPGSRVACVGAKLAPRWNVPVNCFVRRAARPFMTTFRGLGRPWRELEKYAEMRHETRALGGAYVAWGRIKGPAKKAA